MESREHILVVRLTAIGDVLLTLPAVSVLRQNFPQAKISFLTAKENSELLRGFRDVDGVITLDRAILRGKNPIRTGGELLRLTRQLRGGKFTLAVDFQANGESGWLTRLTGARQRWGFVKKPSRRWAYTKGLSHQNLHPADANCVLLQHCGLRVGEKRNEFVLPAESQAAAREFFAAHKLSTDKTTLFIQPFTSAAHKNWPINSYLSVARHWRQRGVQVIFGGGPADRAALEPVRQEGFIISAGVPLLGTGGIMQFSTLVVGGDTGMLHLAVALGKKVLMLLYRNMKSSPTPFQHSDWIVFPPDEQPIAELAITTVIGRLERMLG